MMDSFKCLIKVKDSKLCEPQRGILGDLLKDLPNGNYHIGCKPAKVSYEKPNRYKYYFSGLLPSVFDVLRGRYLLMNVDGTTRHPDSTAELHECLRATYCRKTMVNSQTGEVVNITSSTTTLSDSAFISEYQGEIIMDASALGADILDYDTWRLKFEAKRTDPALIKQVRKLHQDGEHEKDISKETGLKTDLIKFILFGT